MRRISRLIEKTEEYVMIWSSLLLMLVLSYSVFMRYVLKKDVYGLDEIEQVIAFWLYFIAAANCSNKGEQITADILNVVCKKAPLAKITISAVASLLAACVGFLFTYFSFGFFKFAFQRSQRTLILSIPFTTYYIAVVLGLLLMSIYHFRDFLVRVKKLRRGEV